MNEFDWMMYACEHSGQHYFFADGESPIMIPSGQPADVTDEEVSILQETLHANQKRIFVLNKTRYLVVKRGKFYEP